MKKVMTTALLLAVAGTGAGCGGQSGAANDSKAGNAAKQAATPPPAVQTVPNLAATNGTPAPVVTGPEGEVRTLIDQIYAPYASAEMAPRDIEIFFTPELVAAISAREGGIDADPFIDAQDWDPLRPSIHRVTMKGNDRAEANVGLFNKGLSKTLVYQFVRTPAGWKVADIRSGSGNLRGRFNLPPLP